MQTAFKYAIAKRGLGHFKIFNPKGNRLASKIIKK